MPHAADVMHKLLYLLAAEIWLSLVQKGGQSFFFVFGIMVDAGRKDFHQTVAAFMGRGCCIQRIFDQAHGNRRLAHQLLHQGCCFIFERFPGESPVYQADMEKEPPEFTITSDIV